MSWDSPTAMLPLLKQLGTVPLATHVNVGMAALINGKIPSDITKNGYISNNYSTSVASVVRNNNLFCRSIDLSSVSVVNDGSVIDSAETVVGNVGSVAGYGHPGLLISPRHVLGANHWHGKGPWIFKDRFGSYKTVSLVHGQYVPNTDIWIGYLDSAVTTISPIKMLPDVWRNYIPDAVNTEFGGFILPVLTKTVHSVTTLADQWSINHLRYLYDKTRKLSIWYAVTLNDVVADTGLWSTPISGGDSGGPAFLVINNELVLLGTYHTSTGGDTLSDYIPGIQAAMNSLAFANGDDTYYSLSLTDLSRFTSY